MLLFLSGVLGKLLFDRFARKSGRADRVELVAQHAYDLGCHRVVEQRNGIFNLAAIVLRDSTLGQMAARTLPNLLDIR